MIICVIILLVVLVIEYFLVKKVNNQYLDKYDLLNNIESSLGKTRIIKRQNGFDFEFKSSDLGEQDINSRFQKIKEGTNKFNLELKKIDTNLYRILVEIKK